MFVDWFSFLLGTLCIYLQTSGSNGGLPSKRQMDDLIKGVKWNWEHQKTYAVVKSGSGFLDVDVVSKYRLDGRSKLPKTPTPPKITKPPPKPTTKVIKPPPKPTKKVIKPPPKPPKITPPPPPKTQSTKAGTKNLALGKKTTMSSVFGPFRGQNCVNGNTRDFCHTRHQNNPWLRIDLGASYNIAKVVIYNRMAAGSRFRNAFIHVGDSLNRLKQCGYFKGPGKDGQKITINCPGGMRGRYVQVQARTKTILNLGDVQVFEGIGAGSSSGSASQKNIALGKKTSMSSVLGPFRGQNCVNGNTRDFCHTRNQNNPWLRIDLGASYNIAKVVIYNRMAAGSRFRNAFIHVGDSLNRLKQCGYFKGPGKDGQKITINCPGGMKGRYVQVQARTKNYLNLGEVQVFARSGSAAAASSGGVKNLALGKKTTMSSVLGPFRGQNCVNGNTRDFCHTRNQNNPWLRIDLGASYNIAKVVIYNRMAAGSRFRNAFIHVGDSLNRLKQCGYFKGPGKDGQKITINCPGGMRGRYVQVQARTKNYLNLGEVQVFARSGSAAAASSGGVKNLALGKKTTMSSVLGPFRGQNCVNGNTRDFCHTRNQNNPWLRIDLGASYNIAKVVIYNRMAAGSRFRNAFIHVGDSLNRLKQCGYFKGPGKDGQKITINCPGGMRGRYVQVQARTKNYLNLGEVQVMGN